MSGGNVILQSPRGMEDAWEKIQPVLEEFGQKSQLTISVMNVNCGYSAVLVSNTKDELYIRFYAVPEGIRCDRSTNKLDAVFGIPLGYDQREAITPNRRYDKLVRDEQGTIVGEFCEDTLFVLFNLPRGPNADVLMSKILDACVSSGYIDTDAEARRQAAIERDQKILAESRPNFAKVSKEAISKYLDYFERVQLSLKEEEKILQERLDNIRASIESNKTLSRRAKNILKGENSHILDEAYDKLLQMSANGVVKVVDERIEIDMGHVDINFDEHVYDIGDFTLVVFPLQDHNKIQLINRTRIVGSLHHPHVSPGGRPCLGNMEREANRLVDSMELDLLVSLLKTSLATYTSRDAYGTIRDWPRKS